MKVLAALLLMLPLWACEQEGPLERAGEEVDEGIEDIQRPGQTPGNRVDDAVDDLREGARDAGEELDDNR
jgi:hypothetical protein